jgi:hypothetical protein
MIFPGIFLLCKLSPAMQMRPGLEFGILLGGRRNTRTNAQLAEISTRCCQGGCLYQREHILHHSNIAADLIPTSSQSIAEYLKIQPLAQLLSFEVECLHRADSYRWRTCSDLLTSLPIRSGLIFIAGSGVPHGLVFRLIVLV